jgi:3-oxoacyl-[acyl-carrier-protein] synthase II
MRRVVVTGLGLVSPLGCGVEPAWKRILEGKSGASQITHCDVSDMPAKIGCEVLTEDRWDDGYGGLFNADDWISPKEQRRLDRFIMYGIAAATQALDDSGYKAVTDEQQYRSGTYIGSGIGGLPSIEATSILLHEKGPRKVSPFFIPSSLVNLVSGQVSIQHGLKGPNHANATACSTGAHAIGDAARLIALDDADVMVAGGAEAAICRVGMAGFAACRALSTGFNDEPERGSRPYDKDRDGFVMGEGSGVVVLEELEHARARGARIYAEVIGYGLSGDAYHITSPAEDGDGGYRCMQAAMKRAGITGKDIDYVNAHGTSTPKGDEIELGAVTRLFGEDGADDLVMSSTKSSIGHLLGAAGAVETIFSILAMRDNIAPPTINLENPSIETPINLSPLKATKKEINTILSNSFGFGGTNASLILTSNIA